MDELTVGPMDSYQHAAMMIHQTRVSDFTMKLLHSALRLRVLLETHCTCSRMSVTLITCSSGAEGWTTINGP